MTTLGAPSVLWESPRIYVQECIAVEFGEEEKAEQDVAACLVCPITGLGLC